MGTSDFAVPILNSIYKSDHKILMVILNLQKVTGDKRLVCHRYTAFVKK